jgi:hypothetical protein
MSGTSDFAGELFAAVADYRQENSLFACILADRKLWPLNQAKRLWSALSSNIFTIRDTRLDGFRTRDDLPLAWPLEINLTVEVWGNQPFVQVEAFWEQTGILPLSLHATLDYAQIPSDLKIEALFGQWLKGFSLQTGMESLFDGIDKRVITECGPFGVDSVNVIARPYQNLFDIFQVDVTVSSIATQSKIIPLLPPLPVNNTDVLFVSSTPGPLSTEPLRTTMSGSFEWAGCSFDISSEAPYKLVEAVLSDSAQGDLDMEATSRVDIGALPKVTMDGIATLFEPAGALANLPWNLEDITIHYDRDAKEFWLEGRCDPPVLFNDQLGTSNVSLRIGASIQDKAYLFSAVAEGTFSFPGKEWSSWFEAGIELNEQKQWVVTLRLMREAQPIIFPQPAPMRAAIEFLPNFATSSTPVYWEQENIIYRQEQRGGDYHPWPDKYPK